jgi:hypothetical protein
MKKTLLFLSFVFLSTEYLQSQNVGIGTTTPTGPLSFKSILGNKIVLWGDGNVAHYGIGIQSGQLQLHADLPGSDIIFGTGSSASFTERMRIYTFGSDGLNVNGRIVLKNGTNPVDLNYGSGVWMYKADNSTLLGFMGVQNNRNLGFYGGSGGWGFTYDAINSRVGIGNNSPTAPLSFGATLGKKITLYPGTLGDAGFGMAGNRLQIYADNPNADVAIGYDAAGTFNERFAVKANGSLAVSGNAGNTGQVLQSTGPGTAPVWTAKPYVLYFNQTSYASFADVFGNQNLLSLPIPGLDGNTITLQQNSRIVFHTTLFTQNEELISAARFFSDVQIINASNVVVERATCHNTISGGFEKENTNSTGIGVLPAGTYTIRALIRRNRTSDGQFGCYVDGGINPASGNYRGGQMIIEVFPE